MKVILPVAGRDARYAPLTHWLPHCLVPVRQRPLIAWAVEGLTVAPHNLVVVGNERDRPLLDAALDTVLGRECVRVWTQDTAGVLCTLLRAREHIESREPLLIVVPGAAWSAPLERLTARKAEAGIVVTTRQWGEPVAEQQTYSYCRMAPDGRVTEVVERPAVPLTFANAGVYWWAQGCTFVRLALEHLRGGDPLEAGAGIGPVFNRAIGEGLEVRTVAADTYVNLRTAERAARWEGWRT